MEKKKMYVNKFAVVVVMALSFLILEKELSQTEKIINPVTAIEQTL